MHSIGGDLNLPGIDWESLSPKPDSTHKKYDQQLLNIMHDHGLDQVIRTPTRGENILDLCLTTHPGLVEKATTTPGLSDHDAVEVLLNMKAKINKKAPRKVFMYSKANMKELEEDLKTFSENFAQEHGNRSLEENWNLFKTTLTSLMDKHIPHKMLSGKFHLPWLTKEIMRAIRKKQRIYNKAKKSNKEKDWEKFRSIRKYIKKQLVKSYWDYINKILDPTTDRNSKKLWSYLKSKKQDNFGIATLKEDGKTLITSKEKATGINNYFQSVFTKENLDNQPRLGPSPYPPMKPLKIDLARVEKLLTNINPSKASGPDEIASRILKTTAKQIAPILTAIYQQSLDTGTVPSDWRQANITPIFKKGSRSSPKNYRPVSLTSIPAKILEHIIVSQMMDYFEEHNILFENQHGFRPKRSCETQLFMTAHDMAKALNDHHQIDAAILDFAKAFDKVPHERLLSKLEFYGIQGNLNTWIRNFLTNRQQRVVIDGETSEYAPVTSGVPQGTVLGPILFLTFINDIPTGIKSTMRLFADDCLLYRNIVTEEDHHILQQDLHTLQGWTDKWQMQFNTDKCYVMQITNAKKKAFSYKMNNSTLQVVPSNPYLGVQIDDKLTWNQHVNNICSKANRTLGFLRHNMHGCPQSLKEKTYQTLVKPGLEYCASIWDPHTQKNINQVEMVQKRAARFVLNKRHTKTGGNQESVTKMVSQLGWDTLQARRSYLRLTFTYKLVHNLVSVPSHLYLPPIAQTRTRHSHAYKFQPYQPSVNAFKYAMLPRSVPEWNRLPSEVVSAESLDSFKTALYSTAI
jgi:hypothetical protein